MKIIKAKACMTYSIFIWTFFHFAGTAIATSSTCTAQCEEDPKSEFIISIKRKRGVVVESSIVTRSCRWLNKENNANYIEPLCKQTDISHGDAGLTTHEACPITCGVCIPPPIDPPTNSPTNHLNHDTVLGPLENLLGTWEGNKGSVIISLPSQGSVPSDELKGDLHVIPYREVYEIKSLGKMGTPNAGGSLDQTVGACNYTKTVWRTDKSDDPNNQTVIHKEDGMFFYLENIKTNGHDQEPEPVGPVDKAPYAVSRSAVVPHGNTAMIFGNVTTLAGPPTIPDFHTDPFTIPPIPPTSPSPFPNGYSELFFGQDPTYILDKALDDVTVSNTVHFSMSSENGGGVLNTNFITKRSDARDYRVDLWVEDIGDGRKQLQYAEQVNLVFHKVKVDDDHLDIAWPHIMVNTLTKIC